MLLAFSRLLGSTQRRPLEHAATIDVKINVNRALKCRVATQTGGQKVRQTVDIKSGVSVDYT